MSRPHLHNTAEIWVQMEGKLQELSMSSTWSFLTPTCRRPHIEVRSNIVFLVGMGCLWSCYMRRIEMQSKADQRRLEKRAQTCKRGRAFDPELFQSSWNCHKGKGVFLPQTLISGQLKAVVLRAWSVRKKIQSVQRHHPTQGFKSALKLLLSSSEGCWCWEDAAASFPS